MATNVYFNPKVSTEQNLFEDIVIESLKMYGQDVYYIPRSIVNEDMLMNEDIASQFDDAYLIEMYIENTEGFGGQGDLMAKFGLEIRDEATFIVAKRTWEKTVGRWVNVKEQFRPNEGDLIYLPLSNSMFEVTFVEHEKPFYQLSNLTTYAITARTFEYSGEAFDTSIQQIDKINSYGTQLGMVITQTTKAAVGDRLYQASGDNNSEFISGRVTAINYLPENEVELYFGDIEASSSNKSFVVNNDMPLVNDINLPTYTATIVNLYEVGEEGILNTDPFADNNTIEQEGNSFIDFSEVNPFGEPNDV